LGDSRPGLTKQGEDILINILQINGVVTSSVDNIVREAHNALENPAMVRVAVNAAINSLNGGKKE
jgi:hypothetical protein